MSHRGDDLTENRLDVTELADQAGAVLDRALSSVFAEKAFEQNFEDRQMEIALNQGQLSLGQINRIINDARVTSATQEEQTAKSKERTSTMMFIALMDQLERDLQNAIQGHRDYFRDKYGEEYATVLGRPILGDDMPDRLPGESDEDYNKRVEDAVFDEICNPDGTLKDEYKDHPDSERLVKWGKARADMASVRADREIIVDPNEPESMKLAATERMISIGSEKGLYDSHALTEDNKGSDLAARAALDANMDDAVSKVDVSKPLVGF